MPVLHGKIEFNYRVHEGHRDYIKMKYLVDLKLFVSLTFVICIPIIILTEFENSDNFYLLLGLEIPLISYVFWRAVRISSLSLEGDAITAEITDRNYICGGVYKVTLSYTYEDQIYTKTLDVDERALGNDNFLNLKVNKNNPKDFLVLMRE